MYAIIRTQKLKSKRAISGALRHNLREQKTPNADPELTAKNVIVAGPKSVADSMKKYDEMLPAKVRKNAVMAIETVVTASPEWFEGKSRREIGEYFVQSLEFVAERMGGKDNVLSAVAHFDEQTPHMQVLAVPLVDGKLNARKLIGGSKHELAKMQSSFACEIGAKYGLQRGQEKSKAKHQTIKEYYSLVNSPVEKVRVPKPLDPPSRLASKQAQQEVMKQARDDVAKPLAKRIRELEKRNSWLENQLEKQKTIAARERAESRAYEREGGLARIAEQEEQIREYRLKAYKLGKHGQEQAEAARKAREKLSKAIYKGVGKELDVDIKKQRERLERGFNERLEREDRIRENTNQPAEGRDRAIRRGFGL
tara:strand:+ start:304 stop:1404 length:1101 start_codon:yes stop_codon:yes gene_type:complete